MAGITDLKETLKSLEISCDDIEYGFASIDDSSKASQEKLLATFQEDGRVAIIAPAAYLKLQNINHEGPFAKLTIDIHTSLDLVGLTAVMATKLAEGGISANVVAAFYHDHVFVQYDLRQKAQELLVSLRDG